MLSLVTETHATILFSYSRPFIVQEMKEDINCVHALTSVESNEQNCPGTVHSNKEEDS